MIRWTNRLNKDDQAKVSTLESESITTKLEKEISNARKQAECVNMKPQVELVKKTFVCGYCAK